MSNEELVKLIYELVMKEIARLEALQAVGSKTAGCCASSASFTSEVSSIELRKQVLSESDVKHAHRSGACEIIVSRKAVITCLAAEYAKKQGITITRKT